MPYVTMDVPIVMEQYEIVAPPAEVTPVGTLETTVDLATGQWQHVKMTYSAWVFGGGDEYTHTIQFSPDDGETYSQTFMLVLALTPSMTKGWG